MNFKTFFNIIHYFFLQIDTPFGFFPKEEDIMYLLGSKDEKLIQLGNDLMYERHHCLPYFKSFLEDCCGLCFDYGAFDENNIVYEFSGLERAFREKDFKYIHLRIIIGELNE